MTLSVTSQVRLTAPELAAAAGIHLDRLARLIELGVVEPKDPRAPEFSAGDALRLRRALRLWTDLGVNLTGAAIILELLERMDRMEAELTRLRGE